MANPDIQSDKSFKVLHEKLQDFSDSTVEMIKTANVNVDYEELNKLPDSAFAWPEFRKYAMHTKDHATVSLVYAQSENVPAEVTERLEKAASLYDISLENKPLEKVASVKEYNRNEYLIPNDEEQTGMCKVASEQDVHHGIRMITRNRKFLGIEKLAHANKVLCEKARQYQMDLDPSVAQSAGLTQCNLEKVAEWVEVRAMLAKEQETKDSFTKLANTLKVAPPSTTRETLLKVASTIANLDEQAELTSSYFTKLPDPMLTVFNTTKLAEETLYFGGQNVPFSKFLETDTDVYAQVLGDDVVEEITTDGILDAVKLRDILVTLPADLQVALLPHVLG